MSQGLPGQVGSAKHPAEWNRISGRREPQRTSSCQATEWTWSRCLLTSPSSPSPGLSHLCSGVLSTSPPTSSSSVRTHLHSIDSYGHHRAACSRTGVLGRRGFALESAAARVCREAGGRVAANLFVRNMDLGLPRARDNKRLEVVVDGLPLYGGAQLAVDTTLVSALNGDGEPWRGAADHDGVARTWCTRTIGGSRFGSGRQMVRGSRDLCAVVGKGSGQIRTTTDATSRLRWYGITSCAAARSFAASLLGLWGGHGSDGQAPPSHEVERDQAAALSE